MHDWQRGVPGQGQGGGKGGGKPPPGLARFVKNAEMEALKIEEKMCKGKTGKTE